MDYLDRLIERALSAVPPCPGANELEQQVREQTRWFVPRKRTKVAAA
jgi:hypothetical protein